MVCTRVRIISKSAGVIDNNMFDTCEYIHKNISEVKSLARKIISKKGRANNDKLLLVESIVMTTLQPRGMQTEERKKRSTPTSVAKVFGLNR